MGPPLPPHHPSPEVPQPGEGPLPYPSLSIAGDVGLPSRPWPGVPSAGDAGPDTPGPKPFAQGVAQLPGPCPVGHLHRPQGLLGQLHLAALGALQEEADGEPSAPPCSPSPSWSALPSPPPFWAGRKALSHWSLPAWSRGERKARQTPSHTPCSCHSLRRRWQRVLLPYSLGRAYGRQPVFSTHRMPSRVWRSSALRLPRGFWGGRWRAMHRHCSSVSIRSMAKTPFFGLSAPLWGRGRPPVNISG